MNATRPSRLGLKGNRGSALLAVMCFATVLVLALTTFQALCNQTLKTSNRNAQSTHAIELAELGMETAVWSRTNAKWTTAAGGIGDWTISSGTASITLSGANYNFSNGATGSVAISVTNYNVTTYTYGTTQTYPTSVATVTATITLADGSTVARQLKATLKKTEPVANAVAALTTTNGASTYGGTVTMYSGGSSVDSYSSSVEAAKTPTPFPATPTTDYAAIVMASTTVTMQSSATINGYIATAPNGSNAVSLSYTTGTSGSKLKGPSTSATLNIDTTRQTTSPYQNAFDVTAPTSGTALSAPTGTVYLGAYNSRTVYLASAGSLYIDSGTFIIDGKDENGDGVDDATDINSDGVINSSDYKNDVVIVVSSYLQVYPAGGNIIIRNGGSLKLLVAGSFIVHTGGIDNQTKLPKNLSIIGTGSTSSGASSYIYSPTKFYGTVYTPRQDFTFYGYNAASEFFGAMVGSNVYIYPLSSSNLKVHYDKDLATEVFRDVTTPYVVQGGTLKEYDVATGTEL